MRLVSMKYTLQHTMQYYMEYTNCIMRFSQNTIECIIDGQKLLIHKMHTGPAITHVFYLFEYSIDGIKGWYIDVTTNEIAMFGMNRHYIDRFVERYMPNVKLEGIYWYTPFCKRVGKASIIDRETLIEKDKRLRHKVWIYTKDGNRIIDFYTVIKSKKYGCNKEEIKNENEEM